MRCGNCAVSPEAVPLPLLLSLARLSAAAACAVSASLTVVNVLRNNLDIASAKMLAAVAKEKGVSLCGITRGQTEADLRYNKLLPADAILLASDLSKAGVSASLTAADIRYNGLEESDKQILRDAVRDRAGFGLQV